jgi:hypothetical protein
MKNVVKVVSIICVVGAFAAFFFSISFYYRDLPSRPQPELGRTQPINNHGVPLYLTKQEELEQTWSFVLAGVLAVSVALIDRFFDPFERSKREALPKRAAPWNHRWGP